MNVHPLVIVAVMVVAIWLFIRAKKLGYIGKKEGGTSPAETPSTATGSFFPCVIEGSVDAPPMADRVLALAKEAEGKGIVITGDYWADVAAQGGEMMFVGNGFKIVVDAAGQVVQSQSHINLFLVDYPVDGGIDGAGNLGMSALVGGAKVGIKGRIVNGKLVGAEIRKGWAPLIYGVLNGTWRAS